MSDERGWCVQEVSAQRAKYNCRGSLSMNMEEWIPETRAGGETLWGQASSCCWTEETKLNLDIWGLIIDCTIVWGRGSRCCCCPHWCCRYVNWSWWSTGRLQTSQDTCHKTWLDSASNSGKPIFAVSIGLFVASTYRSNQSIQTRQMSKIALRRPQPLSLLFWFVRLVYLSSLSSPWSEERQPLLMLKFDTLYICFSFYHSWVAYILALLYFELFIGIA